LVDLKEEKRYSIYTKRACGVRGGEDEVRPDEEKPKKNNPQAFAEKRGGRIKK